MTALLLATGVSFRFGSVTVFEDVSLQVEPGEAVGLAGPNGAGKSTLLWCLLGLFKPASGAVARRGRHSAVFQNPEDQLFMPTLLEDLALPLLNRGIPRGEAARQAARILADFHLSGYANSPASILSLGLRKRASIAAALVQEPDLLVLDEPTSELDPRSIRELTGQLKRMRCSLLISSHNLPFLAEATQRLLILDSGHIVATGPTPEVLAQADLLLRHGLA